MKSLIIPYGNQSRSCIFKGKDSSAALWLYEDSLRIMPEKKAPNAKETPNNLEATKAMPMAMEIIHRVNNSRVPVFATCQTFYVVVLMGLNQ